MTGVGTKIQVWNGAKEKTSGGLTKKDLMKNPKTGKVVSKKQYAAGKMAQKNLERWANDNGLHREKGKFGWFSADGSPYKKK